MYNRFLAKEAQLKYMPGYFDVIVPGTYVKCSVTGSIIPIKDLIYWNVEKQEAYASLDVVKTVIDKNGKYCRK